MIEFDFPLVGGLEKRHELRSKMFDWLNQNDIEYMYDFSLDIISVEKEGALLFALTFGFDKSQ